MTYHADDTIAAVASAPGGAARGIVRVSGPQTLPLAARLFDPDDGRELRTLRRATALAGRLRIVLDGAARQLPCDLYLWPTSRSYTREPAAEFHTIGSPPLLDAVLAAVCRNGARLAEPGEFTLRAFLSGRIDLTQAEAVLGVIDARGSAELEAALSQLAGGLAQPLQQLREELIGLLAELEAGLDFVDEDIEFVSLEQLRNRLASAATLLAGVRRQMEARYTSSASLCVALVGPPNAGKSSLFNALAARTAAVRGPRAPRPAQALVSPQRGTTRDYLATTIDLDGVACVLTDTAGIEEHQRAQPDRSTESIAAVAQFLSAQQRDQATLRAVCIDTREVRDDDTPGAADYDMIVLTKADLVPRPASLDRFPPDVPVVLTSTRTGEGLDELCATLRRLLTNEAVAQHGRIVAATADRCRESMRLAEASLHRATELVVAMRGDELVAAELRASLGELGKVVGAVYTDDILDRIFSTFCIGK